MKINSLHFKNLNSLKGEFKIDFTDPVLANAGLFAITGPTGSGKSTILDSITLALYSYTPRLEDINDSTISDKGVIVTKHTKEAFSHIEFEVSGQKYKAEWAIAKNRNNNWNKVTHKLSIYEEGKFVTIKDKVTETKAEITRITRLSKDQFTKAIVLSQGKFDEFLKSDKDMRYKLLEIITGTDIYRKIGRKVFEALRLKNEDVKALEAQMGGIIQLSPEEVTALEQNKLVLNNEVKELRVNLDVLNTLKLTKDNIINLQNQKSKIETESSSLQESMNAFRPFLTKLDEHEKVLPLQVDYNNWVNTANEIKNLDTRITELNIQKGELAIQKEKLISTLSVVTTKAVGDKNFISTLEMFAKEVSEVDDSILKIKAGLDEKNKSTNILYAQIPAVSSALIKSFQTSVSELNDFVQKKDEALNLNPLPANSKMDNINEAIEDLKDTLDLYKDAITQKTELERLDNVKSKSNQALTELISVLENQQKELTSLEKQSVKLKADIEVIQKAYDSNLAYMSLDSHRSKLVDGVECPCCGSLDHPYSKTKPKVSDVLEDELNESKEQLKTMEGFLGNVRVSIASNTTKSETVESELQITTNSLNEKQAFYAVILNQLQLDPSITLVGLKEKGKKMEDRYNNFKVHKLWNETKQPLITYIDSLDEINKEQSAMTLLLDKRKSLFSGNSINEYKQAQIISWNDLEKDIATNAQSIKDSIKEKEEKNAKYQSLNQKLTMCILELAFESIDTLKLVLLSDAELDKYKKQKDSLESQRIRIQTKAAEVDRQLKAELAKDDNSMAYDDLISSIASKTNLRDTKNNEIGSITSTVTTNANNQQRFTVLNSQLHVLKQEVGYYKTMSELIGDKDGDKFNNIIQRITLRHLFKMTNDRLATIMDRYQVDLGSDKYEDEIWVIDTYMGDERRVIDSVSGGERFVISLAMALSLSDLASNNVKLDSVFIDEGFGSLSPEELDNAISMLERMQVENEKTVGIISHVESLKERISTQLIVEKLQNGESTISLKSNSKLTSLAVA
jgi:exonuclease SbcC